jgi:hypothetical protein
MPRAAHVPVGSAPPAPSSAMSSTRGHRPILDVEGLRARLRSSAKAVIAAAQVLDPSRLALPRPGADLGAVALVAVYRSRHAARLAALLQQLGPGVTVQLWCLDEPAEALRHLTVGQGPGTRFELLNRLVAGVPEPLRREGLIVSDDDYSFRVGSLDQLVAVGRRLGLDLWQPAHGRTSFANSAFVRRRPGVVLRRTTFVEQGPVLVLSPAAQAVLLPFREDIGMGWGVEIGWSRLAEQHGLRLGILDAVAIDHLPPVGGYDRAVEAAQLRRMLEDVGLEKVEQLQQEVGRLGLREAVRDRRRAISRSAGSG